MFFPNSNFNNDRIIHNSYTLLIPSISTGNIPQLSVDILLSNKTFINIGNFDNKYVEPVVGLLILNDNQRDELTTSLQLYEDVEKKLLVIQQRSPVIKGFNVNFANQIADFVKLLRINQVFILTSIPSFEKQEMGINSANYSFNEYFEKDIAINSESYSEIIIKDDHNLNLSFSGITKPLFNLLTKNQVPGCLISVFAYGPSVCHSLTILNCFDCIFLKENIKWKLPGSLNNI